MHAFSQVIYIKYFKMLSTKYSLKTTTRPCSKYLMFSEGALITTYNKLAQQSGHSSIVFLFFFKNYITAMFIIFKLKTTQYLTIMLYSIFK